MTLLTAMADPAAEGSGPALVVVQTSIGSFEVLVTPEPAVGGIYAGPVTMRELGGAPLPLEVEVVTDPEDTSLADADNAWLALPVRNDTLFAPHPVIEGGPDAVAAELVRDVNTDSWLAVFDHSFALTETGPLARSPMHSSARCVGARSESLACALSAMPR